MPEIKPKHVTSVSSEDKKHPAENLLSSSDFKTWKSASPGEKQVSVLLQLEKAEKIHQIDIGNNHSAFVEVLVGKAAAKDTDFQVLLVASSFMNPVESRSSTNATRVRIFSNDKLSAGVRDEKWDSVKVVCTQPFTKSVQYGISFIKLHSPPQNGTPAQPASKQMKLGAFRLKEDEDDDLEAGSLFARKDKPPPAPLTGAAAVRAAARLADDVTPSTSKVVTSSPKPIAETSSKEAKSLEYKPKANMEPYPSTSSTTKRKYSTEERESRPSGSRDNDVNKPSLSRRQTSVRSVTSQASSTNQPPLKRTKTEPPKKSAEKQFSQLMKKVVFVMSGYENPERGKIREKALEMGAEYKPNWNRHCTHLICAFSNTPKYNEVKGKGRIVDKHWITDSYKKQRLMPWRKYRVGKARSPDNSSGSETEEEYSPVRRKADNGAKPSRKRDYSDDEYTPAKKGQQQRNPKQNRSQDSSTEDETDRSKDKGKSPTNKKNSIRESPKGKSPSVTPRKAAAYAESTDEDTGDELERIKAENRAAKNASDVTNDNATPSKTSKNVYDVDTDSELPSDDGSTDRLESDDQISSKTKQKETSKDDSPKKEAALEYEIDELPDIFTNKCFLLYGTFPQAERRTLMRYIIAYDGVVEDYMGDKVNFVITTSDWDDYFDEALADNPSLTFVKPAWIYACHDKQKYIPHQRYIVTA